MLVLLLLPFLLLYRPAVLVLVVVFVFAVLVLLSVLVSHPTPFVSVANCAANLQTPPALFFCVLPVVCVLHLSRSRKGLERIFLVVDKRLKQQCRPFGSTLEVRSRHFYCPFRF
jgi:hypothetical protein